MEISQSSNTSTIKSVDKALKVLEAFSELPDGVTLANLSEKLDINKSGLYRILQVFQHHGYVEQKQKNGKYHLGIAAFMVGQNIVSNIELMRYSRPLMEQLVRDCNETVYLAMRFDQEVLFFDNVDSQQAVNVMPLKGDFYPLTECAAGEAFLAFDAESVELDTIRRSFYQKTQLATIKHQGYCLDANRLAEGISCLAVPLLTNSRSVIGCLCFVGPEFRFTAEKIKNDLLEPLILAGYSISTRLGHLS